MVRGKFLFGFDLDNTSILMLRKWLFFALVLTSLLATKVCGLEPAVNEETRAHWSFQPVQRPPLPSHGQAAGQRNGIDTFIFARLQQAGLEPSPPATKESLLRRAFYDLIGLPPSPAEVNAFLSDQSPTAFETVVDRLLASPHYGEKWGRHWLDLVRYAETNSYERDDVKPHVWRYRDYVIRSLNDDKPYDLFVREQLAGDELEHVTADSITATGFYRLGIWQDEPVDHQQELFEDLDDIVRTTGEVFLGLSLGCARCHDHKLDPLPQRDYYRFLAFFRNVQRYGVRSAGSVDAYSVREVEDLVSIQEQQEDLEEYERKLEETRSHRKNIEALVRDHLVGVDKDDFQYESNRLAILKKYASNNVIHRDRVHLYETLIQVERELFDHPPAGKTRVLCVTERGADVPTTQVLARGIVHAPGEQVVPGFPSVLGSPDPSIAPPPADAQTCGRRLVLANWIASPKNPLTARVLVNRLWQYHFGRGIVRSPNNFGLQAASPTHPALLDWLAYELVDGGWKLKRMHRLIMLSKSYQMQSRASAAGLARDPNNDLFWRFPMRRLTAEEIRDSILAVSHNLNPQLFGPSVYPLISDEVKAGQSMPGSGWERSTPAERSRRSVYIHVKRSLVFPLMEAFDGPDLDTTCPVRFTTVQPTQSLGMLNGEFQQRQARVFAEYVRQNTGGQPEQQVACALRRVLQREPSQSEIDRGVQLMTALREKHDVDPKDGLKHFCLLAFNLNEFVYLD